MREDIWNWYQSSFYTRLMPGGSIIMTLTRWHEDDLAGRLLRDARDGGDKWEVIKLPALAEAGDLLGREEGEALWPEWYSRETLEQIRRVQSSRVWNSLYQQRPVAEKGNIFKRDWWRWYRELGDDYDVKIHSWDTAFKDGSTNDYSVCMTMGLKNGNIYLIDRWKGRLEFPDLKRLASAMSYRDKVDAVLVEDRSSGQSLIQELRRESGIGVIPVKVDRDKVSRSNAVTPLIEGGRVFLPEWGTWVEDYLDVMTAFPAGEYDDDVDATTQGLSYLRGKIDNVVDISAWLRPRPMLRVSSGGWMVG
jgi:predicted phage terminase large subunit-like protein